MLSLHLAINDFSIEQIITIFLFYILNISWTFSHDKGSFYTLLTLRLFLGVLLHIYPPSTLNIFLGKIPRRRIAWFSYEDF